MKRISASLLTLLLPLCLASAAVAEVRWVGDTMYLPMRSGMGTQYRIIANLKTGTRVTVVSEDQDSEWVEVRTASDKTGFVPGHYLRDTPTAAQQLAGVRKELESLRSEHQQLQAQLTSTLSEGDELDQALRTAEERYQTLLQEHEELQRVSASAVNLHERHQELLHNHELLRTELDVLTARNERLQSDSRNTFFLYGVGAVLLGVVITLTVPHLRRRKRFSEWAN